MSVRPASFSVTTWTVSILIALLIYVLSPHPLVKVLNTIYGNHPPRHITGVFETFYTPLFMVDHRIEPLQRFYAWYEEAWNIAPH